MALSRRVFLGMVGAIGVGVLGNRAAAIIDGAASADPAGLGSLQDIDHFVLLLHENRSFDHYFGAMSSVRGFDDMSPSSAQLGYRPGLGPDPTGRLMPFPLDARARRGSFPQVLADPGHDWSIQHDCWNRGAMDNWMTTHLTSDGPLYAPDVMGYYTRASLPVHYALADAFTVCDQYFSSALGPTAPNRMHWMSGTLDPDGTDGGPILGESARVAQGTLGWPTSPEMLTAAGVSWKVYNSEPPHVRSELSGMLKYFRAYRDPSSQLYRRGVAPRLGEFRADVAAGSLPSVSWLIPPSQSSEHPPYLPTTGAQSIMQVLDILTSNRSVWERTAFIVSYDENGGFFDHVAPPTPPLGTPGEFITGGNRHRPAIGTCVGLGFRVPALIISPYTRGGRVFSDVSDHTSQLKLIARRFGVPVPNLSQWRDATVGDLAGAFQTNPLRPPVPSTGQDIATAHNVARANAAAVTAALAGHPPVHPVPGNVEPHQEHLPVRARIGTRSVLGRPPRP